MIDFRMEESETSEKILSLIKNDHKITIAELSDTIGVSTRSIERNIEKLKLEGKLARIRAEKGGHWKIFNK